MISSGMHQLLATSLCSPVGDDTVSLTQACSAPSLASRPHVVMQYADLVSTLVVTRHCPEG